MAVSGRLIISFGIIVANCRLSLAHGLDTCLAEEKWGACVLAGWLVGTDATIRYAHAHAHADADADAAAHADTIV
jgi:hypothetical protein